MQFAPCASSECCRPVSRPHIVARSQTRPLISGIVDDRGYTSNMNPKAGSEGRGIRRFLSVPILYSMFQSAVGAHRARVRFVSEHVRPEVGQRVLDIGCGTGELVELLKDQTYVGFDPSPSYIAAARARFGHLGEFEIGSVTDPPPLPGTFDLAVVVGVLHHLPDESARLLITLARAQLRPNGRLITLDPVFVPHQNPMARALAKGDRGDFVRFPEQYAALASGIFGSVATIEHHDYLRLPYSHLVMECE